MQIDYDPQADAIYVRLRDGVVDDTHEVSKYIYVDVDERGIPLGLEILFASQVLGDKDLTSVTLNVAHATSASLET
jgi:uncharacterized protein YuzE